MIRDGQEAAEVRFCLSGGEAPASPLERPFKLFGAFVVSLIIWAVLAYGAWQTWVK